LIDSIRYRWEFRLLRDAGRYRRSGPLALRMALDDELSLDDRAGSVRVAFSIGRPVGNAVVRNRVRRRLREILRSVDASAPLPTGRYLILVSPGAASSTFEELHHHLDELLTSAA
jgi:ribonuclease P protein component